MALYERGEKKGRAYTAYRFLEAKREDVRGEGVSRECAMTKRKRRAWDLI